MKTSRRLIIVLIVLWGVASSHLSAADLYQGQSWMKKRASRWQAPC